MYAAIHYGRFDDTGYLYTPGEIIQGKIPENELERFLSCGAIKMIVSDEKKPEPVEPEAENAPEEKAPEAPAYDETVNEAEEEAEEDEEPISIDPTEAIVEPAPVEKPKRSRARKGE